MYVYIHMHPSMTKCNAHTYKGGESMHSTLQLYIATYRC